MPAAEARRPMFSPRNWRVRSKLGAVLLVPAVAFLVLASFNMGSSIRSAQDYGQGARIADFGQQVTGLVHELQGERDLSAGYIAQRRPKPKGGNSADLLQAQQSSVNTALGAYRDAQNAVLADLGEQARLKVERARSALDGLSPLRKAASHALLSAGAVLDQYTDIISRLFDIDAEIGQRGGSRQLSDGVTALNDLSRVKETASQVRGQLYAIAFAGTFQFGQFQKLSGAIADEEAATSRFRTDAGEAQRTLYDETVNGQAVLAVRRIQTTAINRQQTGNLDIDATQWYRASTTRIELIRTVESRLLDSVVATANVLRADAQRTAITTGIVIAAILVIAFLTSLLIARSMINPLRKLRASALDVAENRLPQAIQRLRGGLEGGQVAPEIEPIGVDSRDEIGEVAQTFDAIHREAIRLATEQAALRSNVNSMFVNLSRRSQGLVERQLKLIDELETGEQDPDQLSNLFKLDHLATRMRRNSENLLVLAGEDAGRRWGRPIPLVDVLRAATSEVEQYHRIQLTGVPDVEVMGHAVNHVVHLVAELLENATVFSSPESKVLVHSQRLSDGGAMIEIEDRGIGMAAQEMAEANERLANPPVFDVTISRMMGLFVVGRLAARHQTTVRLRQAELGGVSAFVRLPADVLASRFDLRAEPVGGDAARPAGTTAAPPDQAAGRAGLFADLPRRPLPAPGALPAPGTLPGPGALAGFTGTTVNGPAGLNGPGRLRGPAQPSTDEPVTGPPLPRRTPTGGGADESGSDGRPPDGTDAGPVDARQRPGPGELGGVGAPGRPATPGPNGPRPRTGVPGTPTPLDPLTSSAQHAPARAEEDIRLPIFEQLQSEWFRRRTSVARAGAPPAEQDLSATQPAGAVGGPVPAAGEQPPPGPVVAGQPAGAAPVPAAVAAAGNRPPEPDSWESPADEGWRAAERLLAPTSAGTTRAGLPMRVPQAHLVPGAADQPALPTPAAPPAARSPEGVRSRLASYHQGVRRGRHADRLGEDADRDQPEVLVQTQEQT